MPGFARKFSSISEHFKFASVNAVALLENMLQDRKDWSIMTVRNIPGCLPHLPSQNQALSLASGIEIFSFSKTKCSVQRILQRVNRSMMSKALQILTLRSTRGPCEKNCIISWTEQNINSNIRIMLILEHMYQVKGNLVPPLAVPTTWVK